MWLTEIKGIVESLDANSSYLLVVHQNPTSEIGNNLCENLGQPFHYAPAMSNLNDIRHRNYLGDIGIIYSNGNGIGIVNLNTIWTSLFGGPGTIAGRSIGVSGSNEFKNLQTSFHIHLFFLSSQINLGLQIER